MDINKIVAALRTERDEIERAIVAMEKLGGKKRGRRTKWITNIEQRKPKKKLL